MKFARFFTAFTVATIAVSSFVDTAWAADTTKCDDKDGYQMKPSDWQPGCFVVSCMGPPKKQCDAGYHCVDTEGHVNDWGTCLKDGACANDKHCGKGKQCYQNQCVDVAPDKCKCTVNGEEEDTSTLEEVGKEGIKAVVEKLAEKTPFGSVYSIGVTAADFIQPGEEKPPRSCADYLARFICKGRANSCGRFRCGKSDEAEIKRLQDEWKKKHPDIKCKCGDKSRPISKEVANAVANAGAAGAAMFLNMVPGAGTAIAIGLILYKTRCGTCKCDGGRKGVFMINPYTAKSWCDCIGSLIC
ncbi:hypothetical protein GQ42DRAFT_156452 [Ramicandelaber brevisporus]|nr:hypothetical protein GQ42DRAFT_156452 [Ramicandelaber brevisporus]